MTQAETRSAIQAFSERYRYDMSYQTEILEHAPATFEVLARAQGTSAHRELLPLDAHYVARIAMMLGEDCGDCVLINLRMAVEAGVSRDLLDTIVERPDELEPRLRDVFEHAFDVAKGRSLDAARAERLQAAFGTGGMAELAVCLAGCRLFTTIKRSMGKVRPADVQPGDY